LSIQDKCKHGNITGDNLDNWVCNICLYENGIPSVWSKNMAKLWKRFFDKIIDEKELHKQMEAIH